MKGINWAITLKDNAINNWSLYDQPEHYRAEIGYMLLEYHGKGIVSEAVKEVVKYGFEVMKLHSIEAPDPEK
jgi:ribosomal-protein-alanine N-acetyltransferase